MTRAAVVWQPDARSVVLSLPDDVQDLIAEKIDLLARFPLMYPIRKRGRFRRHRWFLAQNWLVYYKVAVETVYIRGIWPARLP